MPMLERKKSASRGTKKKEHQLPQPPLRKTSLCLPDEVQRLAEAFKKGDFTQRGAGPPL